MSAYVTRWSVLQEHRVTSDDRTAEGGIADAAVEWWLSAACAAYLAGCPELQRILRDRDLLPATRVTRSVSGSALGGHPPSPSLRA